jgi:hypothetical protein
MARPGPDRGWCHILESDAIQEITLMRRESGHLDGVGRAAYPAAVWRRPANRLSLR